MNSNLCLAIKHHPIALLKTGLMNSIVAVAPPKIVVVPENTDAVRELIMQDRHVPYGKIEASLGISSTSIHSILHEHLVVKKICSR